MPVAFTELLDAFALAGFGDGDHEAYVDRRTGAIHYHSDDLDDIEPLPDDIDSGHYLRLPDKRDLGLGRDLALDFAHEHLPEDFRDVENIFRRRGAYARFKDLLHHRGALERWYAFSNAAEEAALREWCKAEGLEVV